MECLRTSPSHKLVLRVYHPVNQQAERGSQLPTPPRLEQCHPGILKNLKVCTCVRDCFVFFFYPWLPVTSRLEC